MTADSLANQDAETTELSAELTEVTWQRLTHVKGKGTVEKVLIFIELHTIYIYAVIVVLLLYEYRLLYIRVFLLLVCLVVCSYNSFLNFEY